MDTLVSCVDEFINWRVLLGFSLFYNTRTVKGAGGADGAFPDSVSVCANIIILHFLCVGDCVHASIREQSDSV